MCRRILLQKLKEIGIEIKTDKWFQNYLRNRKQYIQIDDIISALKLIEEGIPQGNSLAQTLFLIFLNNIKESIQNGEPYSFADDNAIMYIYDDEPNIQNIINEDMKSLHKWMNKHKLQLNTKKTKCMIISRNNNINIEIKYSLGQKY